MKTPLHHMLIASLAIFGLSASAEVMSSPTVMDFEDFDTGELVGQSYLGRSWTGNSNGLFEIVDEGGNKFVRSAGSTEEFRNNRYDFGPQFFDGAEGPTQEGYTGIVDFGFDIAVSTITGSGMGFSLQVVDNGPNFNNNKPLEVDVRADNEIRFRTGDGTQTFTNAYSAANEFLRVNAILNYGTQMMTLSLDNVEQGSFAFQDQSDGTIQLRIQQNMGTNNANYFDMSLDNVSMQIIPEPSQVALLFCGLGALLWARRLRRRR